MTVALPRQALSPGAIVRWRGSGRAALACRCFFAPAAAATALPLAAAFGLRNASRASANARCNRPLLATSQSCCVLTAVSFSTRAAKRHFLKNERRTRLRQGGRFGAPPCRGAAGASLAEHIVYFAYRRAGQRNAASGSPCLLCAVRSCIRLAAVLPRNTMHIICASFLSYSIAWMLTAGCMARHFIAGKLRQYPLTACLPRHAFCKTLNISVVRERGRLEDGKATTVRAPFLCALRVRRQHLPAHTPHTNTLCPLPVPPTGGRNGAISLLFRRQRAVLCGLRSRCWRQYNIGLGNMLFCYRPEPA